MRSRDWLLVVIGVSGGKCSTGNDAEGIEQHGTWSGVSRLEMLDPPGYARRQEYTAVRSSTANGRQGQLHWGMEMKMKM